MRGKRPHFRLTSVAQKTPSLKLLISKIVASSMAFEFVRNTYTEAQYSSICKFFVTFARLQISGLFLDRSIGDIKIHYVLVRGIIIEKEVKSNGILSRYVGALIF